MNTNNQSVLEPKIAAQFAQVYRLPRFKHCYDIETVIDSQIAFLTIEANNRTQAASFAKKQGYVVRSVNMVG